MQQKSFLPRIGIAGLPPPAIPATLQYTSLLDPQEIIDEVTFSEGVGDVPQRAHAQNERTVSSSAATVVEAGNVQQQTRNLTNAAKTNGMVTPMPTSDAPEFALLQRTKSAAADVSELPRSQSNKQLDASQLEAYSSNTQSSNIPGMKKALNGMMQQEHMTQGDTQTQLYPPPQQSESTEIPDLSDLSPSKETDFGSPVRGTKPMLSQSVAKFLEKAKPSLHQAARKLAKAPSTKSTSDIVLCQCGHDEDEGDMVSNTKVFGQYLVTNFTSGQLLVLWYLAASPLLWILQCS